VFESLREAAAEIAAASDLDATARFLTGQRRWDPFAFIDLCEACRTGHSPHEVLCRHIQQREWELLFAHCYRGAIAQPAAGAD
jgi:hypothetical protein